MVMNHDDPTKYFNSTTHFLNEAYKNYSHFIEHISEYGFNDKIQGVFCDKLFIANVDYSKIYLLLEVLNIN